MPDQQTYYEVARTESPTVAGSRRGGGRGTWGAYLGDPDGAGTPITDFSTVRSAIDEIMGRTEVHPTDVKLQRTLPKSHPLMPHLFAEEYGPIQGKGVPVKTFSDPFGLLEAPTFDYVGVYPCYKMPVTFTPRPFALAQDWEIPTDAVTYHLPNGTQQNYRFAQEWLRYTDVERTPAGEWITAQAGQFVFDVAAMHVQPPFVAAQPNLPGGLAAGSGQLKIFLPKEGIKLTWYEVPYAYVDTNLTSFIELGLGCVNQRDISFGNKLYKAGTLLYYAVAIQRYPPTFPRLVQWPGSNLIFAGEKMCDISFIMLYMEPALGKDEFGNTATPSAPVNNNVIQYGHNYVPYAHRNGWYFAKTVGVATFSDAINRPIFPSFPFELLFSKPQ